MGELIDLAPYLRLRSPAARCAGRGPARPLPRSLRRGRKGDCESCERRAAVAEVFRSDAVEAGLGGPAAVRALSGGGAAARRCGPDARRAELLLASGCAARERSIRMQLDWDVRRAARARSTA